MHVSVERVEAWTFDLLRASGLPEPQARDAAWVYARASERGLGHHDLNYLPQRLKWIADGKVDPKATPVLIDSGGAVERWDAGGGLGESSCLHAVKRARELARRFGLGFATMRRSNHFLAGAPYAAWAAQEGCTALIFSNTDAGMSLPGGTSREIGNNPICFGSPRPDGQGAVIIDQCQAYASLGNLKAWSVAGHEVPEYFGTDSKGRPSADPAAILSGGVPAAMGGHKGYGLALIGEILTGVMGSGTTFDQVERGGGLNTHNQSVIVWDNAFFGGTERVERENADLAARLHSKQAGLRLPGDRSHAAALKAQEIGIEFNEALGEELFSWSRRLGVEAPIPLP
jgi:LDH2 family malate/lactate/ureidoglycolate dehydrogenase